MAALAEERLDELCSLCRVGNIDAVKSIVESGEDINARDRWDATPLYYACLTGKVDIVRLLLESGAVCDVNTFDGERCYTSALTLDVRNTLLQFRNRVLIPQGDNFLRFLMALRSDQGSADFAFAGGQARVPVHRLVLLARSSSLRQRLTSVWRDLAYAKVKCNSESVVQALVEYLYSGSIDLWEEDADEVLRVANTLRLPSLQRLLSNELRRVRKRNEMRRGQRGTPAGEASADEQRSEASHIVAGDAASWKQVRQDFANFANEVVSSESSTNVLADARVSVDGRFFYCHRVVLHRCQYFAACDTFYELAHGEAPPDTYTLEDPSQAAFAELLRLLYCGQLSAAAEAHFDLLIELLYVSDMLLAPPAVRELVAAKLLRHHVRAEYCDIVTILKTAEVFRLHQLLTGVVEAIVTRLWGSDAPDDELDDGLWLLWREENENENVDAENEDIDRWLANDADLVLTLRSLKDSLSEDFLMTVFEDLREEAIRRAARRQMREDAALFVDRRLERLFGGRYSEFIAEYNKD